MSLQIDQPVRVRFAANNKSGISYREAVIKNSYPALQQYRVQLYMPDGSTSIRLVSEKSVFPIRD